MFLNDSVSDMGIPHESEPEMFTDPAFLDGEISVPREEESDKESISTIFSDGDSSILDFNSSGHSASWASCKLPTVLMALEALHHLQTVLQPARAREFIETREIPVNPYGAWAKSILETHPDLKVEVMNHLLSVGKYVQAHDIVTFLNRDDVKGRYGLKETVSIATAKHWMKALKFRWVRNHLGVKSMPRAFTSPLGTPKIYLLL
ncbi:MAG: hypothetical protein NXY57DRAFT_1093322 [Lentinula lateritia]|nr:MAG: hypothetical protein NXY57DRAFT_1093322 [Lentinula lateritia]